MRNIRWLILLASLGAILLASSVGAIMALLVDLESCAGNSFQAWASNTWVQTTEDDFNAGVLNQVNTSSSAGDVLLSLIPPPTLISSDNSEVSTSGDTEWHLVKTLTFTGVGASYDELRIDSNLKAINPATASSSIRIDDVEKFSHSTTSTSYESYSDVFDFSSYPDGEHTAKLYLQTDNKNKEAYNSIFELYRTKSYASLGTIASQVLDTGVAGASWESLFWDETLPSTTNITFEVRANDTLFAKDAEPATPSVPDWISVGGVSPVTSGLPSGRYMQWRATLTTSDTSETPTLNEVRVYHY
jgi:hypothetical protein